MITWRSHQDKLLNSKVSYTGLFGGIGNGKTLAASAAIINHSTNNENNLCLVGRLTYPELRDSTREVFLGLLRQYYKEGQDFKVNKAENSVSFSNGSVVIFRHLDNPAALLGPNLGAFYIDQAEEIDEESFLTLQGRLRRPGVKFHQGILTGNPKGHNWVYFRFGLDEAMGSKEFYHNKDYLMITAPTIANVDALPANYIEQLERSYSKEWFERYVEGSWEAFDGQIFDITKISGYQALPRLIFVATGFDPAYTKHDKGCDSAFVTLGLGENGHVYDLESISGKWNQAETLEIASKIISRQVDNPYSTVSLRSYALGVESNGTQRAVYEAVQRYFDGQNIQVIDLKADKDKFRRAKSVAHIIDKGLFHTNNRALINQISSFDPDSKDLKDLVDAMVHALHMVQSYAPTTFTDRLDERREAHKKVPSGERFARMALEEEKRENLGERAQVLFNQRYAEPPDPKYY
jgi:predicted phage terminase large subunit-like protein